MKYIADLGKSRIGKSGDYLVAVDRYIVCDNEKIPRVIDSGNDLNMLLEKHKLERIHVFNLASFVS